MAIDLKAIPNTTTNRRFVLQVLTVLDQTGGSNGKITPQELRKLDSPAPGESDPDRILSKGDLERVLGKLISPSDYATWMQFLLTHPARETLNKAMPVYDIGVRECSDSPPNTEIISILRKQLVIMAAHLNSLQSHPHDIASYPSPLYRDRAGRFHLRSFEGTPSLWKEDFATLEEAQEAYQLLEEAFIFYQQSTSETPEAYYLSLRRFLDFLNRLENPAYQSGICPDPSTINPLLTN